MTVDLELVTLSVPLVWPEVFDRTAPVDVELGCGKGRFLTDYASLHPERDVLAVERAAKYHKLCCDRVARRGIDNVRMLRTTAEDLLFRLLAPASVDTFFVLFPDPWPKTRHHKRRLLSPPVLAALAIALRPGGRLLVKSDHPDYAAVIRDNLASAAGFAPLDLAAAFAELPMTGFEHKYQADGRPIHDLAALRRREG